MWNRLTGWFGLMVIAGLIMMALAPLWQPGIASGDDTLISIYRIFALHQSWQQGEFYPRISSVLAFGYGAPLFYYYPPLASFVAGFLVLIGSGYLVAYKLTISAALTLSALGMFLFLRRLALSVPAAVIAALVYTLAPYTLATIYLRGALAETVALTLLPWILASFHGLLRTGNKGWLCLASLSLAALLITHNAQSLFFLPVLLLFCGLILAEQFQWVHVRWMMYALLLALLMSCFFWLPALVDRHFVRIDALASGVYHPTAHLVRLDKLIQLAPLFDYERTTAFRVGWLPLMLALTGAAVSWRLRQQRAMICFALLLIVIPLGLQLEPSALFWQQIPLVSFIQFPWRLLSFVSIGCALLIAMLLDHLWLMSNRRSIQVAIISGSVVMLAGYSLAGVGSMATTERERGVFQESDIGYRDLYERGRLGFELFSDYQPVTVQLPMSEIPNSPLQTEPEAISVIEPGIRLVHYQGLNFEAEIDTDQPFVLTLNRVNFVGWQVKINGQRVAPNPMGELGLLGVSVPKGRRHIEARWKGTTLILASELFSQMALAFWWGLLLTGLLPFASWHWLTKVLAGIGVVVLFNLQIFLPRVPLNYVIERDATIGNSVRLLGYSIDQEAYQPGDTIHLTLYWLATRPIDRQYKVFVHLRDLGDTQMAAQHDGAPVYGFTPTTRWNPGQITDDVHRLPLDASLTPGTYQLAVGMYDAETVQNLPVEAEIELAGERVVLGPIEVK